MADYKFGMGYNRSSAAVETNESGETASLMRYDHRVVLKMKTTKYESKGVGKIPVNGAEYSRPATLEAPFSHFVDMIDGRLDTYWTTCRWCLTEVANHCTRSSSMSRDDIIEKG